MKNLIKGILAGIMISIGGIIYLSCDNKIVGAFMFAIGLMVIVVRGLNLFTGKVGYIIVNKPKYILEVLITLIGNAIGTLSLGLAIRQTRIVNLIVSKAEVLVNTKLGDKILSIFILSIMCGLLMYIAVNGFRDIKEEIGKYLIVFLGVAVFILCGFEHCVANMFYFSLAMSFTWKTLLYLLVMILGNSVGAFIFPLAEKVYKKNEQ